MARIVNIKKSDGSVGNIPEQFGKLKAKLDSTSTADVTKLYAKTSDGSAQLVWDVTTAIPTDIPTTGPAGPCANQPVCPNPIYTENLLYYPLIPGTVQRWNCQNWSECGNIVGLEINTLISNNTALLDPDDFTPPTSSYATVYNFVGSSPLPPPPGYVLFDYTSFTIADRVAVFLKKNIESTASTFYTLTNNPQDNILFKQRNAAFDNSHGKNSSHIYSLAGCVCDSIYTSCTWNVDFSTKPPNAAGEMPLCTIPPSGSNSFCTCGGSGCDTGCFCEGAVIPGVFGGQTCTNLADIQNNFDTTGIGTNFIVDSTCIATSNGCSTVCYGIPKPLTPSDQTPSSSYTCRYVGKVPNIVAPSTIVNNTVWASGMTPSYFYNLGHSFNDFTILNEAGCLGDPNSAWSIKIFLPFYVNLPDAKWPSGSGLASGSLTDETSALNLKGKYIKITKENINVDDPTAYDAYPILKTIQNLLIGNIKACSAIISFPWDITGNQTSSEVTLWNLLEYPRQISAGVSSHTHQVVVEYSNPLNSCSFCMNTTNNQQFSNSSVIGLYPITNDQGNIININQYDKFFTALNTRSAVTESFVSQRAIYSLRRQYHPLLVDSDSGGLYYWNNTSTFTTAQQGQYSTLYREIYNNTTGQVITFNWNNQVVTSLTNQIGLKDILDRIQQLPISTKPTVPLTACDCSQL